MNKPTDQELKEFANALQLSIKAKIGAVEIAGENNVRIRFALPPKSGDEFFNFIWLVNGRWENNQSDFVIEGADKIKWSRLNLFLLLTRMKEENIQKLVEIDPSAAEIAGRLKLPSTIANIDSVRKCSQVLFKGMEKKKMTIRELSEASGLTQVAISNFRAGGDIRLSSLIKIINALGMRLRIYPSTGSG